MPATDSRKEKWFDRGATAFSKVYPGITTGYVCPLCVHSFPKEAIYHGLLTYEDVPPRSIGGRPLVLTCKPCNDLAGHSIDAALASFNNIVKFAKGELASRRAARISWTGTDLSAHVLISNSGKLEIVDYANRNSPALADHITEHFDRLVETGSRDNGFTVTFVEDAYREGYEWVSLLRAAYLVAFSIFGYRYAFAKALHAVREQIREPDQQLIRFPRISTPNVAPEPGTLAIVRSMGALVLHARYWATMLPLDPTDVEFFDRIGRLSSGTGKESIELSGLEIPWPRQADYASDFEPALIRSLLRD